MSHRLSPLLQPASIAMIGASNNPSRIGGMPLELLEHFGFEGQVYPINPKYEEVFGYTCYPDIEPRHRPALYRHPQQDGLSSRDDRLQRGATQTVDVRSLKSYRAKLAQMEQEN